MTEPRKESEPRPAAWGLEAPDWNQVATELGLPAYRAKQIWHSLQERLIACWDELTLLPAAARRQLAERFDLDVLRVTEVREAADGVRKLLLACRDGELIESVLIPAEQRWTLCISSQAGCAHACAFCASGQAGLARNLVAGEIVGQVLLASRWLRANLPAAGTASRTPAARPQNIVVMGMGEPLANYDEVLRALRILNAPDGLHIGARHITISTCGVVPGILRLAEEGLQFELSVSLHAPNDPLRTRLMPVNRRWPLAELLDACHAYTGRTNRIITFEYTLVRGLNDQPQHARELTRLLRGWKCHVNLIPLSPVAEFDGEAPDERTCEAFRLALEDARIATTLRRSRGRQADAACGQLRLRRRGMTS
jgi:23S rRNA (adenine2503-C2)-methyltransferase